MINPLPLGPPWTERPQKRRILLGAQDVYILRIWCRSPHAFPRYGLREIFPHWTQCKNSTPRTRGPHGPIIPELPCSRPWCLLYPEPKFHADHTILRWDILNRTNKQKHKLNITPNATLYGEIKIVRYMWIWIDNKFAKFHAKRLNLNENIPQSFRGSTFLKHPVECDNWLIRWPL